SWDGGLVEGSWTEGYFSTGQMACADLIGESLVILIRKNTVKDFLTLTIHVIGYGSRSRPPQLDGVKFATVVAAGDHAVVGSRLAAGLPPWV
ncbi:hypothetical protein, partial [Pseudomonas hunanensis]|uniref:hypothetical protein n=1 Tax=Pseudomonas hunanensis TaxID=1247546 RepID=UPI003820A723